MLDAAPDELTHFWSLPPKQVFDRLQSAPNGLSSDAAQKKLKEIQGKEFRKKNVLPGLRLFLAQFKSPLILLLLFAIILSGVLGEFEEAIIIFSILLMTGLLSFFQEKNAGKAVEKLRSLVQTKTKVKRDGTIIEVSANEIVPGDVIYLDAGAIVPGDGLIVEENDLHVNEAALTGESFPAEKNANTMEEETPLAKRKNSVFRGSNVINGSATVLMVRTGAETEMGQIEKEMGAIQQETAFEKGIRKFGYMLMQVSLVLSVVILGVNIFLHKPILDSVLFALALAVGLAPELLPAILTITLSAGARRMAKKKVIVKKLASIQNLGSVDVFCCDKTGTLTEGVVKINSAVDCSGKENEKLKRFTFLNAHFESGFTNPIDDAIRSFLPNDIAGYEKKDEVPYDFIRKRLSIVVEHEGKHIMITKGALKNILEVCTQVELPDGKMAPIAEWQKSISDSYVEFSRQGLRTIGLCWKDVTNDPIINKDDETGMAFLGFVTFNDPPKEGIIATIEKMRNMGIDLKLITGDNKYVAAALGKLIGVEETNILTGVELHHMTDEALVNKVNTVKIFAEVEPFQKERIVRALQKSGKVTGFLGDGINDASAIKAADVGVSAKNAVDVAKEAADIVLLEQDLNVLCDGILEGRKTFANTLKYIFITISANFGNMFSMAGASLFLKFLPLLPIQILLTNFLTDIPSLAIASDAVDEEMLSRPRKWNISLIKKFMIVFGLQSSIFDFLTFFLLLKMYHTNEANFQTGWFIESVLTEVLILFVIRTHRPFLTSRPSRYLVWTSLFVVLLLVVLPVTAFAPVLGLVPLSPGLMVGLFGITIGYVLMSEFVKSIFFKRVGY